MDWDDVRHFLAAARSGSLAGAGRALKVEHTTVARRLTALEVRLGAKLLDRTRSGLRLTGAGDELLRRATEAEARMLSIERLAGTFDEESAGEVVLATSGVLAEALVVPIVPELSRTYPRISLRLVVARRLADLPRREADLALRLRPPGAAVAQDDVVATKLGDAGFGLYASPDYVKRAAKGGEGHTKIRYGSPWEPGQAWWSANPPEAPAALVADDMPTVRAACAAGLGLAMLPHFFARGAPVELVEDDCDTAGLFVALHPDLRKTPRVKAVARWLRRSVPALLEAPPRSSKGRLFR